MVPAHEVLEEIQEIFNKNMDAALAPFYEDLYRYIDGLIAEGKITMVEQSR